MKKNEQLKFHFEEPYKITKPIRLIELFAGYGSQAMALRNIGADFENYRVVEVDEYAIKSYNAVHGTDFEPQDITKIKGNDLEIVEKDKYDYIMFYSWPCQDISYAGLQKGLQENSGTRSSLLWEVKRILLELQESDSLPQILIMENVKALVGKKNMPEFQKWLNFLSSIGYKTIWQVLNTKDYGIPQNRERVFAVSFLDKEKNFYFPEKIPLKMKLRDLLDENVDESFYINNEKSKKLIKELSERCNINDFLIPCDLSINKPNVKEIANCITARDRGISNFKSVGNGILQKGNFIKSEKRNNPSAGRVYSCDGISPTLTNMGGGGHRQPFIVVAMRGRNKENPTLRVSGLPTEQRLEINKNDCVNTITSVQKDSLILKNARLRKLTPRECLRLQGVSEEDINKMEKVNSKTQLYKQAGNSITVSVLEEIFKKLIR